MKIMKVFDTESKAMLWLREKFLCVDIWCNKKERDKMIMEEYWYSWDKIDAKRMNKIKIDNINEDVEIDNINKENMEDK